MKFSNSALIVLGSLFLLPAAAQAPTEAAGAVIAGPLVAQSQPGAQGHLFAAIVPPVPVPPGPVPPSEIKPAPPTPIASAKAALGRPEQWDPNWDVVVEENLPSELLTAHIARAVQPLCPRFGKLSQADRRAFWAYFFQALAGAEAGLKPTANVRHDDPEVAAVDSVTHHTVRQEGLLQLAYMDADRYDCNFDWSQDKNLPKDDPAKTILQPENNLLCGVKILKNQLIDLHQPLLTSKSYWSTLRPGTVSYQVFSKQMANVPAACVARPAHRNRIDEQSSEAEASTPPTASR